jgi:hypothetical protein
MAWQLEIEMNIKPNAPRGPAVYGFWQQVRATDKPDSWESPEDPVIVVITEGGPATKSKLGGTWQQVRATDETESVIDFL